MRKIFALKNSLLIVALIGIALLYFSFLPRHVQGGDTAELVTAARGLFIAHPPGYPLWVLLQSAWLHLFSFSNAFLTASTLTMLFALGTLGILAYVLREKPLLALVCVFQLAFSTAFFESALLPDVFSLHALFVALLSTLFLFGSDLDYKRAFLIPFLFMIALAHHLTILFLAPIISGVFYEMMDLKKARQAYFLGLISGAIVAVVLYLSLLSFHPDSYFSWGEIHSIKDVFAHFLRTDYGSLSFAPEGRTALSPTEALFYFFKITGLEFSMLILFGLIHIKTQRLDIRSVSWLLSIIASLAFFLMVNFPLQGMGVEIITRFHVMPAVLLSFTAAFLLKKSTLENFLQKLLLFACTFVLLFTAYKNISAFSSLKNDGLIESYTSNILSLADTYQARLILADNDNSYFALKYLQYDKKNLNAAVASTPLFFHPWYLKKIQTIKPSIVLREAEKIWSEKKLDVSADLLLPNVNQISILSTNPVRPDTRYALTFLPLGRLVSLTPPAIIQETLSISPPDEKVFEGIQGFSKKLLFSQYAHYFLARGMEAYQKNNLIEATRNWQDALKIVPYCYPALVNLCKMDQKKADCSATHLEAVKQSAENIF